MRLVADLRNARKPRNSDLVFAVAGVLRPFMVGKHGTRFFRGFALNELRIDWAHRAIRSDMSCRAATQTCSFQAI